MAKKIKALFMGEAGCGKTTLCGSIAELIPQVGEVLYLDLEGGVNTFVEIYKLKYIKRIYNFNELNAAITAIQNLNMLYKEYDRAEEKMKPSIEIKILPVLKTLIPELKEFVRFTTIIVDSLTMAQVFIQQHILGINTNSIIPVGKQAEFKDWGIIKNATVNLVTKLKDFDFNLVMTALMEPKEYSNGQIKYYPSLEGSARKLVSPIFSIVGAIITVLNDKGAPMPRILWYHPQYEVKFRGLRMTTKAETYMDDPTLQKIYNLIPEEEKI